MDEELRALAIHALRNAFYQDFSSLVNRYLDAAEGLDVDVLEMMIQDGLSVYSRDEEVRRYLLLEITATLIGGLSKEFVTIAEALGDGDAHQVWVNDEKIFERQHGEWMWVGD